MEYNKETVSKIDWVEIQRYYDDGNFWRDLIKNKKFKLNNKLISYYYYPIIN